MHQHNFAVDYDAHQDCGADFSMMLNIDEKDDSMLSVAGLQQSGIYKCGPLEFKNSSIYSTFCPCWFEKWESSFFVLAGSFLFHFKSPRDHDPATAPIPVEAIRSKYIGDSVLEISTIREKFTLRGTSQMECAEWVKAIASRRAQAIKESMGHVAPSENTAKIDNVANKLYQKYLLADDIDSSAGERSSLLGMER